MGTYKIMWGTTKMTEVVLVKSQIRESLKDAKSVIRAIP